MHPCGVVNFAVQGPNSKFVGYGCGVSQYCNASRIFLYSVILLSVDLFCNFRSIAFSISLGRPTSLSCTIEYLHGYRQYSVNASKYFSRNNSSVVPREAGLVSG